MRHTICALIVIGLVAGALPSSAATIQVAPNVYRITEGVAFSIANSGLSDYLFSWSDESGSFSDVADPTLVLRTGETYTFARSSGGHPFVITDDTLPVSGSDGTYTRITFDGAVIDAATLEPLADFTADPAPTTDLITWTPQSSDLGDAYYTCRVTSHPDMTGRIEIESAPVPISASTWSSIKSLFEQ